MIKNIKSIVLVFLAAITFSSCSAFRDNRTVNPNVLELGMSKEEAQKALKKNPGRIIATRKDPQTNALIQVVAYYDAPGNRYWLYFIDDKLDRWQPALALIDP
ncbi:MAG: hypothetical protein V4577_29360 [Bacteroidota bacterium]